MKKRILLLTAAIFFAFSIVSAQTETPVKTISGGVLNGKAKSLAKPAYPAAARAVKAEGAVSVQILIDEEGNVVTATAVSGHPLLRQAAEQAALNSKFAPTTLSGQPVKVSGVVVYNFIASGNSENWVKVGYDLATFEKLSTVNSFSLNALSAKIPSEWTTESEQVKQLQSFAVTLNPPPATAEKRGAEVSKIEESKTETIEKTADGAVVKKMTVIRRAEPPPFASPEQIAVVQSLTSALQGRLGGDPKAAWQFNFGIALGRAFSNIGKQNDPQMLVESLRQQINAAPDDIAPEYLENARKIVTILEAKDRTPEQREQIGQLLSGLFKN
jgi:TonB family protein